MRNLYEIIRGVAGETSQKIRVELMETKWADGNDGFVYLIRVQDGGDVKIEVFWTGEGLLLLRDLIDKMMADKQDGGEKTETYTIEGGVK